MSGLLRVPGRGTFGSLKVNFPFIWSSDPGVHEWASRNNVLLWKCVCMCMSIIVSGQGVLKSLLDFQMGV